MLSGIGQECCARKPHLCLRLGKFGVLIATLFFVGELPFQSAYRLSNGFVSFDALPMAAAQTKKKKKRESSEDDASEALREQAKQQAELERELAKQQAEFEREQSKQQAEFEREQAKQQAEFEKEGFKEAREEESEREKSSSERESEREGNKDRLKYKEYDDDEAPARTLLEMFRRMTRPEKPKSASKLTRPKKPKPGSRSGGGGRGLSVNTSRAGNEILAVNLSQAGSAQARKLGFKVRGSGQSSHLRGSLTRLVPPRGLDAAQARDLMQKAQPGEQFAVNQRYRFYQPARKETGGERSEPARHLGAAICTENKCFGRQAIRWHDDIQPCASGLRVGVIDTQVDHQHPAFSRAKIHIGGFLPDGAKPAPAWHGTGVLSVLAGDTDSGTPGLIPQANFYAANVFFQDEKGGVETDTVSVLNALEWMSAFDVKIVNMSFSGPKDELVEKAIERMSEEGVIFVAAVGNDGPTAAPSYPASYRPVIAVTAVGKELRNYPYANRGDRIDAAAPGVDIWSAVPNGREGYHTGTSFAAPYVTAILATVYNGVRRIDGKDELLDRLGVVDLGPPGRDPIYGRGLILAPATCGDTGGAVAQAGPPPEETVQVTVQRPNIENQRVRPSAESLSFR